MPDRQRNAEEQQSHFGVMGFFVQHPEVAFDHDVEPLRRGETDTGAARVCRIGSSVCERVVCFVISPLNHTDRAVLFASAMTSAVRNRQSLARFQSRTQ